MKRAVFDTDHLDVEIGARVRHIRKMRGLSQSDLGHAIGVTFQQIQKYERGSNRISSSALILIARALEVSPGVLLGEDGEAAPTMDWRLLSEEGAHEFMQAVGKIRSPEDRRIVFELARSLAKGGDGPETKRPGEDQRSFASWS